MPQFGDVVRVVYDPSKSGDDAPRDKDGEFKPYRIMWNSRTFDLTPNEGVWMPYEAATLWFGDGRASAVVASVRDDAGVVAWIPDRETEVRRLRVKYGVFAGPEDEIPGAPFVKVYDTNGDEITTILSDPTGESVIPVEQTQSDRADLQSRLDAQQRQIDDLLRMLQSQGGQVIRGGGSEDSASGTAESDSTPPPPPQDATEPPLDDDGNGGNGGNGEVSSAPQPDDTPTPDVFDLSGTEDESGSDEALTE